MDCVRKGNRSSTKGEERQKKLSSTKGEERKKKLDKRRGKGAYPSIQIEVWQAEKGMRMRRISINRAFFLWGRNQMKPDKCLITM